MKNKKNIYLLTIDDCFDYISKIEVLAFSTFKKAIEFYNEKIADFLQENISYDVVTKEPEYFLAYNEGCYAEDHYEISIQTKEIL